MVLQFHTILEKIYDLNLHSVFFESLLLIFILVILSFFIDFFLARSFVGKYYRFFVAPGVIVHELAHAAGCLLTGAKISKISLFEKNGGSVEHMAPKIPIIGQVIISFAPFVVGTLLIYLLSIFINFKGSELVSFHWYENVLRNMIQVVRDISSSDYKYWIAAYIIISIGVTMTPSITDLKNAALSLFLLAVMILVVFCFTNLEKFHLSVLTRVVPVLNTVAVLLILILLLSIIMFIISKIVTRR